ncbi:TPA: hypothetical protein ACTXF0_003727 [Klebsiella pneumoniae]
MLYLSSEKRNDLVTILKYELSTVLSSLLTADKEQLYGLQQSYHTLNGIINKLEQLEGDDFNNYVSDIEESK